MPGVVAALARARDVSAQGNRSSWFLFLLALDSSLVLGRRFSPCQWSTV